VHTFCALAAGINKIVAERNAKLISASQLIGMIAQVYNITTICDYLFVKS
jgi:hypothetical protein